MAGNYNLLQNDAATVQGWQNTLTAVTTNCGGVLSSLQNSAAQLSNLLASYNAANTAIQADITAGAGQAANTGFPTLALTVQADVTAVVNRYTTILAAINAAIAAIAPAQPGN